MTKRYSFITLTRQGRGEKERERVRSRRVRDDNHGKETRALKRKSILTLRAEYYLEWCMKKKKLFKN